MKPSGKGLAKLFLSGLLLLTLITGCGSGEGKGGWGENTSDSDNNKGKLRENALFVEKYPTVTLASVTDNVYTYTYSGAKPDIQAGTVLIGTEGNGYLRKAVSVQDQNGTLVVDTEPASLTEAFEELHLKETITLNQDIYQEGDQGILQKYARSIGTGGSVGLKIAGVSFTGSGDYDVSVDGDFNLKSPSFDIEIDIFGGEQKTFNLVMNGAMDLNLNSTLKATKAINIPPPEFPVTIAPITLFVAMIPVPVGPFVIPIIITGEFNLTTGITFSAAGETSVNFGFNSTHNFSAGFKNNNSSWLPDPVASYTYSFNPYMNVDKALVFPSVKVYARPKVGVYIYDVAGPYIDMRPYGKGTVVIASEPKLEAGIGITANVGGEAKILSWALGTINLELMDLYYPVWTYTLDDTTAPSQPYGVTATGISPSQIDISWLASTDDVGIAGYKIYRDGTYLRSVSTTWASDIGLKPSTQYCYTIMAYDSAGNESLESSTVCATTLSPKIIFLSKRDGNWEIYAVEPDGSNITNLTNNLADDRFPAVSPGQGRIAFVSDRDGNNEIYVMGIDGSNPKRLTYNSSDDVTPVWSPDGDRIAFVSNRDGNYEIYMMNPDGSGQYRKTNNYYEDSQPYWSPEGTRIIYVSKRDGNNEIYLMDTWDSSFQVNLTKNSADDNIPFFSPDGSRIGFVSDRDGDYDSGRWINMEEVLRN